MKRNSKKEVVISLADQDLFTAIWEEFDADRDRFEDMVWPLTTKQFKAALTFYRNSTHVDHWKTLQVVTVADWEAFIEEFTSVWEANNLDAADLK